MIDVAFVTSAELPDIHDDDAPVADALRRRGIAVTAAVWDDSTVDWTRFSCVVIRCPWDYHLHPERYAAWLRRCAADRVNLWNPPQTVLDNIDKRYLRHLEAAGVAIVPLEYLERGQQQSLGAILERRAWTEAVVKPAVSASAFGTWRTSPAPADDERRFDSDLAERALLVQPLAPEVSTHGEWSLVFFDGDYSHAVLKRPAAGDFRVQQELGGDAVPLTPPAILIEDARRILAHVPGPLLYARVDGVERDGRFLLMELEINEPLLYIATSSGAAARFAEAIVRRCAAGV